MADLWSRRRRKNDMSRRALMLHYARKTKQQQKLHWLTPFIYICPL